MLAVDEQGNIQLTRGDTGLIHLSLTDSEGEPYNPSDGDTITFSMAKKPGDTVLLQKDIPYDTMDLVLEPADSKELGFATYAYDIQVTDAEERVSTVILAKITFTKEVG